MGAQTGKAVEFPDDYLLSCRNELKELELNGVMQI